jgi:hypothetical protein
MLSSRIETAFCMVAFLPRGPPEKGRFFRLRQLKMASFPATSPLGLFSRRLFAEFQGTFGRRTASPARGPPLQRRDPARPREMDPARPGPEWSPTRGPTRLTAADPGRGCRCTSPSCTSPGFHGRREAGPSTCKVADQV